MKTSVRATTNHALSPIFLGVDASMYMYEPAGDLSVTSKSGPVLGE